MDLLSPSLVEWLLNYGVFALFVLLALGIIALPIPEETLLVFSGILIHKGTFDIFPTFLAAYLGSITGITVSYLIGATGGHYLIHKYGKYFGITEKKLEIAHRWAEKYGRWMLFIGYFVPGVRHFTGVFAGVSELGFHNFSLFAYTGALCWVITFLSLGFFFGSWYHTILTLFEENIELLTTLAILVGLLAFFIYLRWNRNAKSES